MHIVRLIFLLYRSFGGLGFGVGISDEVEQVDLTIPLVPIMSYPARALHHPIALPLAVAALSKRDTVLLAYDSVCHGSQL